MVSAEEIIRFARDIGFSHVGELEAGGLVPMDEVREMCASGRCKAYGRLWSCPPACGSIEFTTKRIRQFDTAVIVQTTGTLDDDFDAEAIFETEQKHKRCFETLSRQVRSMTDECLPLTAGGCRICLKCTYPDKPCRFPKRMLSSMEAYGLLVSDICLRAGLEYNYGARTITYTSCILIKTGAKNHADT